MLYIPVYDFLQPLLDDIGIFSNIAHGQGDPDVFAAEMDQGDGRDEILGRKKLAAYQAE